MSACYKDKRSNKLFHLLVIASWLSIIAVILSNSHGLPRKLCKNNLYEKMRKILVKRQNRAPVKGFRETLLLFEQSKIYLP